MNDNKVAITYIIFAGLVMLICMSVPIINAIKEEPTLEGCYEITYTEKGSDILKKDTVEIISAKRLDDKK